MIEAREQMVSFLHIFGTERKLGVTTSICTPKQVRYCPCKVTLNQFFSIKAAESRCSQNICTSKSRHLPARCHQPKRAPRDRWVAAALLFAPWETKWQGSTATSQANSTASPVLIIQTQETAWNTTGPTQNLHGAKNMLQGPYVLLTHKDRKLRCSI